MEGPITIKFKKDYSLLGVVVKREGETLEVVRCKDGGDFKWQSFGAGITCGVTSYYADEITDDKRPFIRDIQITEILESILDHKLDEKNMFDLINAIEKSMSYEIGDNTQNLRLDPNLVTEATLYDSKETLYLKNIYKVGSVIHMPGSEDVIAGDYKIKRIWLTWNGGKPCLFFELYEAIGAYNLNYYHNVYFYFSNIRQ